MLIEGVGAVVTGGASGLGEATVRRLARAGSRVTILDRDQHRGEALANELGGATRFVHTDVTDPDAVSAAGGVAALLNRRRGGLAHPSSRSERLQ